MDSEILDGRLSAAETALLKLDERLDAMSGSDLAATVEAQGVRLTAIEGILTECQTSLTALTTQKAEAEAEAARLEAEKANQLAAEAESLAALALAAATTEPEPEPEPEPESEVTEIAPEPEDESAPEKSTSWWENLLALR